MIPKHLEDPVALLLGEVETSISDGVHGFMVVVWQFDAGSISPPSATTAALARTFSS